jgi:hypothetical protein
MSDKIVRDLLNTPEISNRAVPARILIDGRYFDNQSSSRINKNIIAARIRNNLNRFSKGRMIFVDRRHLADVKRERRMKREGEVERGSLKDRRLVAGVDYQMTAEIMSDDFAPVAPQHHAQPAFMRSPDSAPVAPPQAIQQDTLDGQVGRPLAEVERDFIELTIRHCNGSIPKAARLLEVSPSTLYRKIESWKKNRSLAS